MKRKSSPQAARLTAFSQFRCRNRRWLGEVLGLGLIAQPVWDMLLEPKPSPPHLCLQSALLPLRYHFLWVWKLKLSRKMEPPCPLRRWTFSQVADKYIHIPASSNVSFSLMRLSVRCFRVYSYGFEGFGETASCLCRPPHTSQHSTAQSAAMTSRPLPSDTRPNTAPILQARIPEQWSPKQAASLSPWQRVGLPFLSTWVTHGDLRG